MNFEVHLSIWIIVLSGYVPNSGIAGLHGNSVLCVCVCGGVTFLKMLLAGSLVEYGIKGSSVQFSPLVVSDSLWPREPQHARPPYPSPTPGVYPNSCPLIRRWHPTVSSSIVPFSSCPQSFPVSGSFPVSQLFASGGQSIGVSASMSVLPMNTQDWSPCSPRDSPESSPAPQFKRLKCFPDEHSGH